MISSRPIVASDLRRFELIAHHSPPRVYDEETHETVQVCVPLLQARYSVARQSETGRALVHELGARDVLVIPAGQPHAVTWKQAADVVMLHLSESFLVEALGGQRLGLRDAFTVRDPFISAVAVEVRQAMARPEGVSLAFAEAVATVIVNRISQANGDGIVRGLDTVAPLSSAQMTRIERYVDGRLNQPIRLADLAEVAGLSMWHFMRRFTARVGITPHDFVTERRLARARTLLATSGLSIAAIAIDVGMTHSHFSRAFLGRVGVSPREYRRRHERSPFPHNSQARR